MEKVTYDEALEYFRKLDPQWTALINGLRDMREGELAKVKRNLDTPNVQDRAHLDMQLFARITVLDDIICELQGVEDTGAED